MSVIYNKVALIGLGLIAGSIALAAREAGVAGKISGTARSAKTRAAARDMKLVDEVAEGQSHRFSARTEFDAPEVDNSVQIVDGDADPGAFCRVRIVGATEYDLEAVVVGPEA